MQMHDAIEQSNLLKYLMNIPHNELTGTLYADMPR